MNHLKQLRGAPPPPPERVSFLACLLRWRCKTLILRFFSLKRLKATRKKAKQLFKHDCALKSKNVWQSCSTIKNLCYIPIADRENIVSNFSLLSLASVGAIGGFQGNETYNNDLWSIKGRPELSSGRLQLTG